MSKINLSDNIREDICEEVLYLISNFGKVSLNYVKKIINDIDNDSYKIINRYQMDNNVVITRYTSDIFKMQMYTDYYRVMKYKNILNNNENLVIIKPNLKQINHMIDDNVICANMLHCMLITYMCLNMERVLANKCLNKEDIEYLSNLNPYFKDEHERYNTNIDLEYVKNEIKKLKDEKNPNIEYLVMSNLIFNYYKINKQETEKLLIELFNQDLGIITSDVIPDEYIKLGQVILSKENLALMLRDYYKFEEKKLKLKKDDNNEL